MLQFTFIYGLFCLVVFVGDIQLNYDLQVQRRIPQALMDQGRFRENGSVDASSVLVHDDHGLIQNWLHVNLVLPVLWECPHADDVPADASGSFRSYESNLVDRGFSVRNVQNDESATGYINIHYDDAELHQRLLLAGSVDYVISAGDTTKADYMFKAVGIVLTQASEDVVCEMHMMLCLLIFMNTQALRRLHGFLVYKNGTCRVYKASRSRDGGIVREQDDTFHVCHIVEVLEYLLTLE